MSLPSPKLTSDTISFFQNHAHTSSLLNQPSLVIFAPANRMPKASTEDSFFALTIRTSTTIPHVLSYYPRPEPTSSIIPLMTSLYSIGDDLNGFPGIIHGGISAALIDEAMGVLLVQTADLIHVRLVGQGKRDGEYDAGGMWHVTKSLGIKYKRPVRTPGILRIDVSAGERKGREWMLKASLMQRKEGDDGNGEWMVCVEGEGVFVEPRAGKM